MVKEITQKAENSSIKQTSSNNSVNHVIGRAIAKYRKAAGMSQEKLAEELGLRNEAVSRMERGIVIPTVERLIEMAEIFDCPVSELLTETSTRPTDEAMRLHYLLALIDEGNRQWLIDQFEQWVHKLAK